MSTAPSPTPRLKSSSRHAESHDLDSTYVNGKDPNHLLKQAIWAYFLLLIFEGALRKWFLPSLATPLLAIRDPIALWLVVKSMQRGLLPSNIYLTGAVFIGTIGVFSATFLGHGSLPVAIYGARILLIHFPLIFVIGSIFDQDDVIKIGKATLVIAIPMAFLITLQFYSPQSAWVNRGIGGDMEGAGFSGAMGYMRPPGTFSFTNGLTLFYSLVASFVFYFWLNTQNIHKLVLLGATLGLFAAIPLSISRSLFFTVGVIMIFTLFAVTKKPEYIGKTIGAVIGLLFALVVLSQVSFFQTATEAFTNRFDTANNTEGGVEGVLLDRYLGGLVGAILGKNNESLPFFGYGQGMGTNVGSMLLTGKSKFLIAEGEWGRLIGEFGPFFGMALIFIRISLSAKISLASFAALKRGDLLPWILLSLMLLVFPQGQWAQPTSLGFSTLIVGLVIASLNKPQTSEILHSN
ncbi:hypothetical protein [Litoribacter ruber]|uniref:hypothetical protein n=1 Tax=Litoribacter ruber TaxID=702568 RepID=UPI001FE5B5AB|nr:hypothetical protein [Litoribacter ruber]